MYSSAMNRVRLAFGRHSIQLPRIGLPIQRRFESSSSRSTLNTTPTTAQKQFRAYGIFIRPFAKVFLGSLFTFQVLYWCWEKLRLDEIRGQKLVEVKELESQLEDLTNRTDRAVGRPIR